MFGLRKRLRSLETQVTEFMSRTVGRLNAIEATLDSLVESEVQRQMDDLDLSDFLPKSLLKDVVRDTLVDELESLEIRHKAS